MKRAALATLIALVTAPAGAALDVLALWDFGRPEISEQRFRDALAGASGDDALILRTQIARTFSLRGRFDEAHRELDAIAAAVAVAGPEAKVRSALERGRTWRSSGHPAQGQPFFDDAWARARDAGLEELAADALHMLALVAPTLDDKIAWHQRGLAFARAARAEGARRWTGPMLNNLGSDLRDAGRLQEALEAFRESREAYERSGRSGGERVARWQIAHTLRLQGRIDDALAMQLQLERDSAAAGRPDGYVFDELALLYAARGDATLAQNYRDKRRAMK